MCDINQLVLEALLPNTVKQKAKVLNKSISKPKRVFGRVTGKVKRFYDKHEDNIDPVVSAVANLAYRRG